MHSNTRILLSRIGILLLSAGLAALGTFCIADTNMSLILFTKIMGGVWIAAGILSVLTYFVSDLYQLAFQYGFGLGLLLIVLGLFIFFHPNLAMNTLSICIGIGFLVSGVFSIQIANDARKFGIVQWPILGVLALIQCGLGIFMIFAPDIQSRIWMILIGILLWMEAASNICLMVYMVKSRKQDGFSIEWNEREV